MWIYRKYHREYNENINTMGQLNERKNFMSLQKSVRSRT